MGLRPTDWSLDIPLAGREAIRGDWPASAASIPKGLHHSAQGCAPSATLGARAKGPFTLKGLNRGLLHTIMCGIDRREWDKRYDPFRVDPPSHPPPRVARRALPWVDDGLGMNPEGVVSFVPCTGESR